MFFLVECERFNGYGMLYNPRSNLSWKDGKSSNKPINTGTKIFVIDPSFSGVHGNQRISNNVFKERTDVNLAKDEAERITVRITKHNKLVARCCFIHMKFVRRCTIVNKLFISVSLVKRCKKWNDMKCGTYFPDSFRIIFRRDRTTPYTSFASSSKGNPVDDCGVGAGAVCNNGGVADSSFTAITTPVLDDNVLRGLDAAECRSDVKGATARETPGRMPPSTACFGRLVRCQS
jgi:hypothetical protein